MLSSRAACAAIAAMAAVLIVMAVIWDTGDVSRTQAFGIPLLALVFAVPLSAWRRDVLGTFLLWAIPIVVGVLVLDWLLLIPPLIDSSGYFGCDFEQCRDESALALGIAWPAYLLLILLMAMAVLRALGRFFLGPPSARMARG